MKPEANHVKLASQRKVSRKIFRFHRDEKFRTKNNLGAAVNFLHGTEGHPNSTQVSTFVLSGGTEFIFGDRDSKSPIQHPLNSPLMICTSKSMIVKN